MKDVLQRLQDAFAKNKNDKGRTTLYEHSFERTRVDQKLKFPLLFSDCSCPEEKWQDTTMYRLQES